MSHISLIEEDKNLGIVFTTVLEFVIQFYSSEYIQDHIYICMPQCISMCVYINSFFGALEFGVSLANIYWALTLCQEPSGHWQHINEWNGNSCPQGADSLLERERQYKISKLYSKLEGKFYGEKQNKEGQ